MYNKNISISGTNNGYMYFIDKEHPLATGNSGRVYLHRHLASIYLGRWLDSEEHVHHIDSDKLNNSVENLQVLSATEHAQVHKGVVLYPIACKYCKSVFKPSASEQVFCSKMCSSKSQVKDKTLTKEVLEPLIGHMSWGSFG